MKNVMRTIILLIAVSALFSCTQPLSNGMGSLKISVDNEMGSKTLVPELDIVPASYRITGTGPEDAAFDVNTTEGSVTIDFLRFGEWTINIEAFNADGSLIASGSETAYVNVEGTTNVPVTITLLDGAGTFDLEVSWPLNEVENPVLSGVLKPGSGTDILLNFEYVETMDPTAIRRANTGNTLPVGFYTLIVKVNDLGASGTANHLAAGVVEIVKILKDQTTYGNYNLQGVPGMGKIDVQIEQDFNNPIEVIIENNKTLPAALAFDGGASFTAIASVPAADEDAANITYVWYLNGETIGVDSNLTISMDNSPLTENINGKFAIGHYRLDVTAFNSDGSRAGSTSFEFDVTGNPGVIVSGPTATPTPDGPVVVSFPDPNLEAVIRTEIDKPAGDIYDTDLAAVTYINGMEKNISDISGLEYCTNLRSLLLPYNSITDITPLSGLTNLQSLHIYENPISDISQLSGMTNLQILHLSTTSITDITPVSGLTNLIHFSYYNPDASTIDITPLSGLTNLEKLALGNTLIEDITPLKGLTKLTELHLTNSGISDITPLSDMTELTFLNIYENSISDITPLSNLTKLTFIDLSFNPVADLSPLSNMTNLEQFNLTNGRISDITPLANLTNLTYLHLYENAISDVTPLSGLVNLKTLHINHNSISDVTPLSGLTNLIQLNLRNNSISDITPLADLTKLEFIDFTTNSVSEITVLSGLTNLTGIDANSNLIADISPLKDLTKLQHLFIENNNMIIKDDGGQGTINLDVVNTLLPIVNLFAWQGGNIID